MTREDFIKTFSLLGLGAVVGPQLLTSCKKETFAPLDVTFTGKVLIIGAGAAGMMAAYMLQRYGVDFEIIEASSIYGGRVKRDSTFADYPLDLGAEWIHEQPSIFSRLIKDPNHTGSVDLVPYNPQSVQIWNGSSMISTNFGGHAYGEYKFKHTTWYGFFEKYIVPSIVSKMIFNEPVESINYSGSKVQVTTNNQTYEGDKVIVTAPIKILQNESILFSPALPSDKINAINSLDMPGGFKAAIEFSERFYPDMIIPSTDLSLSWNYLDAMFKKGSNRNVLALFVAGSAADQYTSLGSDQAMIDYMLQQLDDMFDGKASQTYIKHTIQNWSAEPYIQGSYTFNDSSDPAALRRPVNSKVYFAGEAFVEGPTATVHGAGLSGISVAENIMTGG